MRMNRKWKRMIGRIGAAVGFMFTLGIVGSMDLNRIGLGPGVLLASIGMLLFYCGLVASGEMR